MNRTTGLMALCLVVGAAVMYGGSRFRLRVESAAPQATAPEPGAPAQASEPRRLPEDITNRPDDWAPPEPGGVTPAGALLPAKALRVKHLAEQIAVQGSQTRTVLWKAAGAGPRLFTACPTIVLDTALAADTKLKVVVTAGARMYSFEDVIVGGPAVAGVSAAARGQTTEVTLALDRILPADYAGGVAVEIITGPAIRRSSARVAFAVPSSSAAERPVVERYSNSPFLPPKEMRADTTPVEVYGTFFQLHGQQPQPKLTFVVQLDGGYAEELAAEPQAADAGCWTARVAGLKEAPAPATGFVAVRGEANGRHAYAEACVVFGTHPTAPPFGPPAMTIARRNADGTLTALTPGAAGKYTTDTPALAVTVTAPAGAQGVVLFANERAVAREITVAATDTEVVFAPVELGTGTPTVLRAVAVRGAADGEPAIAVVEVRPPAPPPALPPIPGPVATRPAPAPETVANYQSAHADKPAAKHTAAPGADVVTRYDPVANIVTLVVRGVAPGSPRVVPSRATFADEYAAIVTMYSTSPVALLKRIVAPADATDRHGAGQNLEIRLILNPDEQPALLKPVGVPETPAPPAPTGAAPALPPIPAVTPALPLPAAPVPASMPVPTAPPVPLPPVPLPPAAPAPAPAVRPLTLPPVAPPPGAPIALPPAPAVPPATPPRPAPAAPGVVSMLPGSRPPAVVIPALPAPLPPPVAMQATPTAPINVGRPVPYTAPVAPASAVSPPKPDLPASAPTMLPPITTATAATVPSAPLPTLQPLPTPVPPPVLPLGPIEPPLTPPARTGR